MTTTFSFDLKQIKPVLNSLKKFRKDCGEKRLTHTLRIEIANLHDMTVKFSIQGLSNNRFFQCIAQSTQIISQHTEASVVLDYDAFETAMKGVKKSFEIEVDGEKVTLKNGLVQSTLLKSENGITFEVPKKTPDNTTYFNLDKKTLLEILDSSEKFAGNDSLRPHFNGHYFECIEGQVVTYVTDAHKLKHTKHKISSYSGKSGFLVPTCLIPIVREWAEQSFDYLSFEKIDKYIAIKSEKFRLFFLDEEFSRIDFEHILPKEFEYTIRLDKNDLIKAVTGVLPATNKTTKLISITFCDTDACVVGQNLDMDTYAIVDFQTTQSTNGDLHTFHFNADYLTDALKAVPSDVVEIGFNHNRSTLISPTVETIIQPVLVMPLMGSGGYGSFGQFSEKQWNELGAHYSVTDRVVILNKVKDIQPTKVFKYIRRIIDLDKMV